MSGQTDLCFSISETNIEQCVGLLARLHLCEYYLHFEQLVFGIVTIYIVMVLIVVVFNRICLYVYVYLPDIVPASVFGRAITFEPLEARNFTQMDIYLQYLA